VVFGRGVIVVVVSFAAMVLTWLLFDVSFF